LAHLHTRRLPHIHEIGRPLFVTWRLHGTLPGNRPFPQATTSGEAFLAMDRLLAQHSVGPLYLKRPDIAQMVVEAIQYRDPAQYLLHNLVVMPNHVHILITPKARVAQIMRSLKRFTARQANRILGLTGSPFWQDESYYRLVRTDDEFDRIARYIEMNPVHAGIVTEPEQFPWSSSGPIINRPQVTNLPHFDAEL
jgi:REP-associated tyrosine transposase